MKRLLLLAMISVVALSSCKKQTEKDQKIIEDYMEDNNIPGKMTESGLWFQVELPGTGVRPTLSDEVTVYYKGYLTDGTVFDETVGQPAEDLPLAYLIKGWQEGLQLIKEGGEILLLIPSHLGYGDQPTGNIPANSVIIFEIELVQVN